ncbi:MAG TPA: hypothetical protein VK638_00650 [Edaphobacter sp.]|nr:hypothetical protein [Edaphobacter sp.]
MEQTAALPIDGEELIKVILFKLGETLRKDCFLRPHFNYLDFGGRVEVKLWLGGQIKKVSIDTSIDLGPRPSETTEEREGAFDIENGPPDELRVETGQDVQVVTKDDDGRTVLKPVHYARKGKRL